MSRNDELFARAQRTIPAGVNSPVRAFRSVGGTPRFFERGEGAYLWDVDGNALHRLRRLVGPGDPRPRASGGGAGRRRRRADGACRSARRPRSRSRWPRRCAGCVPSIEMVRLVSSGTEATMSALRLARGFTGRSKIVKFEGCYHGHGDSLLVKAGSGALTFGQPSSAGVPPAIANETIVLPYNDLAAVEAAFAQGRREHRLHHRRADRRQHEPDRAAGPGFLRGPARGVRPARRRADLRRGDDRLPRAPARRAGRCTASRRT